MATPTRMDSPSTAAHFTSLNTTNDSAILMSNASNIASCKSELRRRLLKIHVEEEVVPGSGPEWMFPGDGSHEDVIVPDAEIEHIRTELDKPVHLLGEWPSTAICGNDILSSVLYSSGIIATKAGKLSFIPLLIVSFVLYLFRFIYEEAVTAIPLNGGSYNVLLNTTSKRVAAIAATLSIISYIATGVVSASSAVNYLKHEVPSLPLVGTTIGLLGLFACLCLIGINESSRVALLIFCFHVVTLSILSVSSLIYTIKHPHILRDNWSTPLPNVDFAGRIIDGNVFTAIFFGFSSAMLGVTGFESSANFVEEQQPKVFRKTMRNMWGFSIFFNTILAILNLGVMSIYGDDGTIANSNIVLALMGYISAGKWLELLVAIDAFIVLSGAVLTSYVGVNGLVRRLANDRVMPSFLANTNKLRGTNHNIIIGYFLVATSLVLLLNADIGVLSGVYSYAFLSLMALFAFGCMMLKLKRTDIPRDVHAPWWACIFGFVMIIIGIFGVLLGDPSILMYFALYFIAVALVVFAMLERLFLIKVAIFIVKMVCTRRGSGSAATIGLEDDDVNGNNTNRNSIDASSEMVPMQGAATTTPTTTTMLNTSKDHDKNERVVGLTPLVNIVKHINGPPVAFFIKRPNLTVLNKAILYVRNNEMTHNLRIIHVHEAQSSTVQDLQEMIVLFDHIYPKLRIDLITIVGVFDSAMIEWISKHYDIHKNMMFIKQPGNVTVHKVSTRGVRVITG